MVRISNGVPGIRITKGREQILDSMATALGNEFNMYFPCVRTLPLVGSNGTKIWGITFCVTMPKEKEEDARNSKKVTKRMAVQTFNATTGTAYPGVNQ